MTKVEAAIGAEPDAVRRLGALGVCHPRRCRTVVAKTAACQQRARAACIHGRSWGAFRRCTARRPRRRCFTVCGRRISPIVSCSAGRARLLSAHDAEWRALATLPQHWTAPVFPLKAADFMKRGVAARPRARRGACRGGASLDHGRFSGTIRPTLDAIAEKIGTGAAAAL